jgi:hypothetical protein
VLVSEVPFQSITELAKKPVPVTVNVKEDPPTVSTAGDIEDISGTELAALTVSVALLELLPLGFGLSATTLM